MPLSEHEERMLAEIERRLAEDDPRFMARARRASAPDSAARRLRWSAVGFVVGLLLLLGLIFHFLFGVVGFALMLVSVLAGASAVVERGSATARRLRDRLKDLSDHDDNKAA